MMKKLRHLLEYFIVWICFAIFSHLPLSWSALIWRRLAILLYHLALSLAQRVRDNISQTIGKEWPADRVEILVKRIFREGGNLVAELLTTRRLSGSALRTQVTVEGLELLDQALALKRGCVVISGHFGNWEMIPRIVAEFKIRPYALYKHQANPYVDRLIQKVRSETYTMIDLRRWREETPAVFQKGEVLGIASDQDAGSHGIFIEFLGRKASTFVGPAKFAIEANAPLLACFNFRDRVGQYRFIMEAITMNPSAETAENLVYELTSRWMMALERCIRQVPEQYFWFHRRWKTRPPAETPGQ